ncbi:MAG: FCD domain-containing protein [Pseudomonadota bacterium]
MTKATPPTMPSSNRRGRSLEIETYLRQQIAKKQLSPGDRLPTESALTQRFSVSRSVVREAIACLRAEVRVETRQGAGLFVADFDPNDLVQAPFWNVDLAKTTIYVEVLELRAAVESEAAALAAERSSVADIVRIKEKHVAFQEIASAAQLATDEDLEFHLAVAMAANNRQFVEFFECMVRQTFMPVKMSEGPAKQAMEQAYLGEIAVEHESVLKAIADRKPQEARDLRRQHIHASMRRVQEL